MANGMLRHRNAKVICNGCSNYGKGILLLQLTGCNFLFSQFIQNNCPAGTFVANDLTSGALFQLCNQFRRESGIRKGLKWFCKVLSVISNLFSSVIRFPLIFYFRLFVFSIAYLRQTDKQIHGLKIVNIGMS